VLPNEVIDLYRLREISAVDVAVYSALCSLRREYDGVRVSQKRLAFMCGIKSEKTIAASVHRLYLCGLIKNVIIETVNHWKKYKTSIYCLKPLPDSGFFFVPRQIFRMTRITPKMFAVYFFLCCANHCEYGKSWNSYGDLCVKMGFGKGQRSEVMRLIGELVERGLLKKTVRRIKGVYVDNIYRITGFDGISTCLLYRFKGNKWELRGENYCSVFNDAEDLATNDKSFAKYLLNNKSYNFIFLNNKYKEGVKHKDGRKKSPIYKENERDIFASKGIKNNYGSIAGLKFKIIDQDETCLIQAALFISTFGDKIDNSFLELYRENAEYIVN